MEENKSLNKDNLMTSAKGIATKAQNYVTSHVGENPILAVGAASALGFILGHGLFKSLWKVGLAYIVYKEVYPRYADQINSALDTNQNRITH